MYTPKTCEEQSTLGGCLGDANFSGSICTKSLRRGSYNSEHRGTAHWMGEWHRPTVDWARCHFGLLWCGIWSSTGLVSFQVEHHPGKPRVSFRGKTHYLTWFKAGLLNKRQAYVISSSFSQDGLGALLILVLGTKARAFYALRKYCSTGLYPKSGLVFLRSSLIFVCFRCQTCFFLIVFLMTSKSLFSPGPPFSTTTELSHALIFFPLKKRECGTGEMAQWGKILVMPVPWLEFNP